MLEALLLGLVQGATEFLPISSSGHLALIQNYFSLDFGADFDVFLHLGTLLATFLFFKKEISQLSSKYLKLILIATLPALVIGLLFQDIILSLFTSSSVVGIGLLITSFALLFTANKSGDKQLTASDSLLIGIAQAVAMIPGISRSGSTITTSLFLGVKQSDAFTFSFLLSIPAISGASLLNLLSSHSTLSDAPHYLIGASAAAVSGYYSLKLLSRIMKQASLYKFAYYTLPLGLLALLVL